MKHLLLLLAVLLAVSFLSTVARAAPGEALAAEDLESIAVIRQDPESAVALRNADDAFQHGLWEQAAALFGALPVTDEDAARYPLRRTCQALTELGRRAEALQACHKLLERVVPNAADLQAQVAALMLGLGRPLDKDLQEALWLMKRIEGLDPDSVWTEAARCAIAQRMGDRPARSLCSARLSELAPGSRLARHYTIEAAQPPLAARLLKFGLFGGLLAAALLTLGHRLFSRRRRGTLAASLGILLLGWSLPAVAQDLGYDEQPASGPNYSGPPTAEDAHADSERDAFKVEMQTLQGMMNSIKAAEALIEDKHDWRGAVAKYNEIVAVVPYFAKGWRRLCEGYSYLGMPVEGAHSCRQVLASPESNAWDRAMLVHYLLTGPTGKTPDTRIEAKQLAGEAVEKFPAERWGYDAQCELALVANDLPGLKACSAKLDQLAHDDRKTIAILFSIALQEKRFTAAEQLIERARSGGMDEPSLANMRKTLAAREPFLHRLRHSAPLGLALGAAAAALALLIGLLMSVRNRNRDRARLGTSAG